MCWSDWLTSAVLPFPPSTLLAVPLHRVSSSYAFLGVQEDLNEEKGRQQACAYNRNGIAGCTEYIQERLGQSCPTSSQGFWKRLLSSRAFLVRRSQIQLTKRPTKQPKQLHLFFTNFFLAKVLGFIILQKVLFNLSVQNIYFLSAMSINQKNTSGCSIEWINDQPSYLAFQVQNRVISPRIGSAEDNPHARRRSLHKRESGRSTKITKQDYLMQTTQVRCRVSRNQKKTVPTQMDSFALREEKAEIVNEIMSWIKLVESTSNDAEPLEQTLLPKLQSSLYKWCFFIEEAFELVSQPPATPPSLQFNFLPQDIFTSSQQAEISQKDQQQLYEKEIQRLSLRIREYQQEIETNRVNNMQSLTRILELQELFVEWGKRVKMAAAEEQAETHLNRTQIFLEDLKQTLTQDNDCSKAIQKIEERLKAIQSMKICQQDAQ